MADVTDALSAIGVDTKPTLGPAYAAGVKRLGDLGGERAKAQTEFGKQSADVEGRLKAEQKATDALQPPKLANVSEEFKPKFDDKALTESMQTMFAFAAIGGMMTRQPMTAALTAFNGALKGYIQGDQIAYQRDRDAFDRHLKTAMAKNQQAMEEYRLAFEKHKGNTQALMNEWSIISKKHGDTVSSINAERQDVMGMLNHIESMKKMDLQMKKTDAMLQQGWKRLDLQQKNAGIRNTHLQLMDSLAKDKAAGGGKLTESEQKATTNWNEMTFSNTKMDELAKKGVTNIPISSQTFGRLYNPETGGIVASVQQEIRNSMSSPEEKQAFDSALAYTLAQAHAQGGARPSAYQVQMIWNAYIPMEGEDPETQQLKAELRGNAISSIRVMGGHGVQKLEQSRAGGAGHPVGDAAAEAKDAKAAIASGADPAKVRARYKERTGQELTE